MHFICAKKVRKLLFLGGSVWVQSVQAALLLGSQKKAKKSLSRKVHCKSFSPFSQAREIEALFSVSYHSRHNFGPKRKKLHFPDGKKRKPLSRFFFCILQPFFYLSQSIIRRPWRFRNAFLSHSLSLLLLFLFWKSAVQYGHTWALKSFFVFLKKCFNAACKYFICLTGYKYIPMFLKQRIVYSYQDKAGPSMPLDGEKEEE